MAITLTHPAVGLPNGCKHQDPSTTDKQQKVRKWLHKIGNFLMKAKATAVDEVVEIVENVDWGQRRLELETTDVGNNQEHQVHNYSFSDVIVRQFALCCEIKVNGPSFQVHLLDTGQKQQVNPVVKGQMDQSTEDVALLDLKVPRKDVESHEPPDVKSEVKHERDLHKEVL
jgi:hypothetical protein